MSEPTICRVCFGRTIVTTVVRQDGLVEGTTTVACGGCGRTSDQPARYLREIEGGQEILVATDGGYELIARWREELAPSGFVFAHYEAV